MNVKIFVLTLLVSALLCSCSEQRSVELELQRAEMAVAQGDMTAARNIASRITDSNLSGMPASQLCRLSIVYMQMADSTETDNNVAMATKLYRRAYDTDADSAGLYYSTMPQEHMQYAAMLTSLVNNIDNPYESSALHDENAYAAHEDSIPQGDSI